MIADCIDWLADDKNVDIINMSFGDSGYSSAIADAAASAYADNNLLVSIANNRNSGDPVPSNVYPAEHDEVIGVSGVLPDSTFADGNDTWCVASSQDTTIVDWGDRSNHGDYVELSAPFYTNSTYRGSYDYANVCGTSFAAPHVAAVAALLWEKNPSWTNEDVRGHLNLTAHDLGAEGDYEYYGSGLVDAYEALNTLPPEDTLSVSIQGPYRVPTNAGEMCAWSAYVTDAKGPVAYEWEWDGQVVSTQDFYVSDESTPGWYWLELTVWDDYFERSDGRSIEVVDEFIQC